MAVESVETKFRIMEKESQDTRRQVKSFSRQEGLLHVYKYKTDLNEWTV